MGFEALGIMGCGNDCFSGQEEAPTRLNGGTRIKLGMDNHEVKTYGNIWSLRFCGESQVNKALRTDKPGPLEEVKRDGERFRWKVHIAGSHVMELKAIQRFP